MFIIGSNVSIILKRSKLFSMPKSHKFNSRYDVMKIKLIYYNINIAYIKLLRNEAYEMDDDGNTWKCSKIIKNIIKHLEMIIIVFKSIILCF